MCRIVEAKYENIPECDLHCKRNGLNYNAAVLTQVVT